MTISDSKINNFFSKHKVGALTALKDKQSITKKPKISNDIDTVTEKALDKPTRDEYTVESSNLKPGVILISNTEKIAPRPHELPAQNLSTIGEHHVSNSLASSYQNGSDSLATREQQVSSSLPTSYQQVSRTLATGEQNVSKALAKSLAASDVFEEHNGDDILTMYSNKETELLYIIYEKCAHNCSHTCTIYSSEIISKLIISTNRLRNLFSRIIKKGGLVVLKNKRGLNALRIVSISNNLYKQLHATHPNSLANSLAVAPHSSSSINNTTATKASKEQNFVDISLLSEYGFTEEHASQLLRITSESVPLNPEIIQKSINYFYYDLKYNSKEKDIKKTPVQFFMGIMRNEKIYNPPKNYKSQTEIAMEVILNQETEEQERVNKKIENLKKSKCEQWLEDLDNDTKGKIISAKPKEQRHTPDIAFLRIYYSNNVWPKIKNNLLNYEQRNNDQNDTH